AYLVGPHQITQLSIDHSWANDVVRQGRYTPQDALDHPKAGELRRSVGFERRVLVDIGFYAGIDPLSATNLSRSEITQWTLTPGDRVLLCSDGLIANRPSPNLPFVSNAEIVRYINAFAPQTACETLCELAVSRRANDNVSVLIIETAGSSRRQLGLFFKLRRFLGRRRRFVNWFLLILFLLLVVGLAIWVFVKSNLSLEYVSILNVLIVNLNAYEAVQ
ncbi:MAG: SpoIIE family protein phosphatase, partial [Chloroflexota bacterium]